jgi:hypothetical protein
MSNLRGSEPKSGGAPAAPSEDVPDWMSELQSPRPTTPAATPAEDVPDWMSDLRGSEPKSGGAPAAPSEDVPDWMSELQSPNPTTPAATPAEDVPDWMSDLRGSEPKPGGAPAAPSEDVPDWMNELQSPNPTTPDAASAEDVPDWMSDLRGSEPKSGGAPAAPSEDVPDWMSELQSPSPATPAANEPVWDDNLQTTSSVTLPAEVSDTPDWLSSFQAGHLPLEAESATRSSSETAPARLDAIPSQQDDSDWAPISPETQQPASPIEPRPAAPTEADWLSRFGISDVEKSIPAAPQPSAVPTETDDTPDWLKNFNESTPPPPPPAQEPAAEKADVPDWLRDFQPAFPSPAAEQPAPKFAEPFQQPAPVQEPAPVQKQAADDGDTPEWLKDFDITPFTDNEPAEPRGLPGKTNLPQLPMPQKTAALEETSEGDAIPGQMPDWLANVSGAPAQPANESSSPFGGESLPSWMKNQQPVMDNMARPFSDQNNAPTESTPFANREMDELLDGVSPEKPQGGEGENEAIEMAQMPTWLQAMRPVESGISNISDISGVDDQRIEKSGPLAGLRGVLPGEEVATRYRKLPSYTNKLQVSEKQHIHARLLEDILAEEKQPKSGGAASTRGSQLVLRLLVAVLLITMVLVPSLTSLRLPVGTGLPATQVGLNVMFKSINEFPSGGYALLVTDYEAGLNGELKMAAMPVLRHLQTRQPKIVIASTLQIGAAMGDALLQGTQQEAPIPSLVNLGYIGGGTNALRRLMLRDGQNNLTPLKDIASLPYLNGVLYENRWNAPALAGLKDINSFQRIIVITDSVENARNWIEQVQPLLDKQHTQLVMISSAQAAPLIRAYLASGQISGLVSGLAGGAAYEQRTGQTDRPGSSFNAWTAYQLTIAVVIVLILAGAATAGVSAVIRNSKSKRKA